jgi:hypothetical protein
MLSVPLAVPLDSLNWYDAPVAGSLGILPVSSGDGSLTLLNCYPTSLAFAGESLALTGTWQPVRSKLDYWNRALEATYEDIAFTEHTLLYDRSSSIVQRQREKASALQTVIDQLSDLRSLPGAQGNQDILRQAELNLLEFADAFTLHHEFGHYYFTAIEAKVWEPKKREIRLRRDHLTWGRMLRCYFRPVVRDIRRLFRTLVRTLLMHKNDPSEVMNCWCKEIVSHQSIFPFTKKRSYMDKFEILARIELIIANPGTQNEEKIVLKQGCDLIKKAITREQITQAIEFLAAIAGLIGLAIILLA